MRSGTGGRRSGAFFGQVLPGGDAVHIVRRRSGLSLSLGYYPARFEDVRILGNVGVCGYRTGRTVLCLEKRCAGLGRDRRHSRSRLMALTPAITDLEQLKSHPAVARLVAWNPASVTEVRFDREELTIWIDKSLIRDACAILRDAPECPFDYLCDLTALDWLPSQPRFEVVYHLLSLSKKERVRLKARVDNESPVLESVTSVWPSANNFEREVFDLFGIRFTGHPRLERLMMPDDWEGHPLRKDYPVEGYR